MTWLPLFLMLCGIGPSQASQIAATLDAIDQAGLVCPDRPPA
ncbi:hypothetical protein [Sphingomonas sp. Leaf343]|nr:hypothetical protein [Sphingomonas sp. Leaf343]